MTSRENVQVILSDFKQKMKIWDVVLGTIEVRIFKPW